MVKKSITVNDVCNLLNEMLQLDYTCVHDLVLNRTKCNEDVANHPTIQVSVLQNKSTSTVGLLGLFNGLFGIREDGFGPVCMVTENGKIIEFKPTPKNII